LNLLLDTHVFIWWDQFNPALNPVARAAIEDPQNNIFVSAASVWEIAIKQQHGKLRFSGSSAAAIAANGFFELPMLAADAEQAGGLPWTHADPFDRMLVAQAMAHDMVLVTADETIRAAGLAAQLWAG